MAKRQPSALNLLFAVDKPVGCTSHDVVGMCRRALGERRIGHAGTLDPLASGVMVLGVGQATRLLGLITQDTKSYIADIAFGSETDTDDAEGRIVRTAPVDGRVLDMEFARDSLARTRGKQMQVPPAYSAVSVDGVRSYKRARQGDAVDLPARPVDVLAADLIAVRPDGEGAVWTVAYTVSKGTYIRALARDLGRSVGSAAHLVSLRRTASGCVTVGACSEVDSLDAATVRSRALDPVRVLGLPAVPVGARDLEAISCGRPLPASLAEGRCPDLSEGARLCLVAGGRLVALGRMDSCRIAMTDVFPQPIDGARL